MGLTGSRRAVVLAVALIMASNCATLQQNPTQEEQAAVRQAAAGVVQNVRMAVSITRSVGPFVDALPLSVETKNEYDRAILAVTGTTAAPGPLYVAIDVLQGATSMASLRATASVVSGAVQPLVDKLKASDNQTLRIFGALLEEAIAYAKRIGEGGDL